MKRNAILFSATFLLLTSVAANGQVKKSKNSIIPPPPPEASLITRRKRVQVTPVQPTMTSATDDAVVTVGQAGPYSAKNVQVQRFTDYLEVKPGQDASLTMHIENNGFSWFRIFASNELVASNKDIKGDSGDISLSGMGLTGNNQIVIQAGGRPGSTISWKVTAKALPKLDAVAPDEAIIGDEIKLTGQRFSTTPSQNKVYFNNKTGQVKSATDKQIVVVIPKDAEPGDNKVFVKVVDQSTNTVKMKVRGIPEITSSNLQGVAPGQYVTIYGKNFSKDMKENKVFFGDTTAEIIRGDTNSLTVMAPYGANAVEALTAPLNVKVQVGKIASKNSIPIQLGPKMFHDPGVYAGPDTPTLPAGFQPGADGGIQIDPN